MKTNYTIQNFRTFDSKGAKVEFAPLTFLVGCNSSGKSSIVKSLFLLKSLLEKHFNKADFVIGSTIDFSSKPIDSLGSFHNVVHATSRKKEITLSYQIHSAYLNDDVIVKFVMGEGQLGSATIIGLQITNTDGDLLYSCGKGQGRSGNLVYIKNSFKCFLAASRFRSSVQAILPPDPFMDLSSAAEKKIQDLEYQATKVCDVDYLYEVYHDRSLVSPKLDEHAKRTVDKFVDSNIITYFSLFDEIVALSDAEELSRFLKARVTLESEKDELYNRIDLICRAYRDSGADDFLSFYRSLEDEDLMATSHLFAGTLDNNVPFSLLPDWLHTHFTPNAGETQSRKPVVNYYFVYNTLTSISDNDPSLEEYEYYSDYYPMKGKRHSLFAHTFKEYVELFIAEVISKDVTERIEYISSSRIQVRRMYPMEDRNEFTEAVKRYYNTRTAVLALGSPIEINVSDVPGCHKEIASDFAPGRFMNKWLRAFGIGDHMSLEMDKNGLGLLLKMYRTESDKKGVLLADMGYGITQLFSILLQIEEMIMSALFDKYHGKTANLGIIEDKELINVPFEPRTVAIEEPEIHLHPKYQSLLAEMFYEAYKDYNIQFIIETHSEYLLRKVQTLVGSGSLLPDDVSMIYVEDDVEVKKGAQKVRRIPIKADGRLAAPFSPGFYDEADNLSLELFTNMGR